MKPSHALQVDAAFAKFSGKAIDFPQSEYDRNKAEFDRIAGQNGYRLAGYRLDRAVFTSKPEKEVAIERE